MITYNGGAFGYKVLFRLHGSAVFKSLMPSLISSVVFILLFQYTNVTNSNNEQLLWDFQDETKDEEMEKAVILLAHPYPMGALIAAFSFLLIFRANFAYNRYWEAQTAVHMMHSKWLDFATDIAAFHYQSDRYKQHKPPAFGSHPDVTEVTNRERARTTLMTMDELADQIDEQQQQELNQVATTVSSNGDDEQETDGAAGGDGASIPPAQSGASGASHDLLGNSRSPSLRSRMQLRLGGKKKKSPKKQKKEPQKSPTKGKDEQHHQQQNNRKSPSKPRSPPSRGLSLPNVVASSPMGQPHASRPFNPTTLRSINRPTHHENYSFFQSSVLFGTGSPNKSTTSTKKNSQQDGDDFYDAQGNPYSTFQLATRQRLRFGHLDPDMPPLFLEECAHLLSLLSAVAFSTLRNDLEQAESPLAEFRPGVPWPHVDPDAYSADVRKEWARSSYSSYTIFRYLFGISRDDKSRTLYNAGRPFRVIGNVSDREIELLQNARGPQAKVALCSLWLQEFLTREHMNGSTGMISPAIISRLYQFVSDGMAGFNQARKVAYIPFPFPHAQITTLFVLVICGAIPIIMLTYVTNVVFGFIMNLCCVTCFTGLHEVARELEAPFQNVPNDIPLNNFQAQFNEGLMVMFFGFHPDAYWKVPHDEYPKPPKEAQPAKPKMDRNETFGNDKVNQKSQKDRIHNVGVIGLTSSGDDSIRAPSTTQLDMADLDQSLMEEIGLGPNLAALSMNFNPENGSDSFVRLEPKDDAARRSIGEIERNDLAVTGSRSC